MPVTPVQTKRDVQAILASAGLRPHKRFGQNFLIDGNFVRKLVEQAEIGPGDTVLEVGGGTGGLSDLLADAAGRLIIVEIDHDLAPLLRTRFAGREHVEILHTDVLSNKNTIAPVVLDALARQTPATGRGLLVANLPYNIATPLIMNLLTAGPRVERFCFSIQKEVGDRLMAQAGGREFGPLAVGVQTTCRIERFAKIPPSAFWPAPKVESAMFRLDRRPHAFEAGDTLRQFLELVHAAFAHRRKTLRYNLGRYLDKPALDQAAKTLDLSKRAEAVDLEDWIELGRKLLID